MPSPARLLQLFERYGEALAVVAVFGFALLFKG